MKNRWSLLNTWRLFWGLAALQGAAAILAFIGPTRQDNILQGLSNEAYILIGFSLFILALCLFQLLYSFVSPAQAEAHANRWKSWISKENRSGYSFLILIILLVLSSCSLTLASEVSEPFSQTILRYLSPFLAWACALISLMLFLMFIHQREAFPEFGQSNQRFFWFVICYFFLVFLGWIWLIHSIYPIISERVGWNSLGVPVLEYQSALAWGSGLLILFLANWLKNRKRLRPKSWHIDFGIALLIWASAVILWQAQPIQPNWFVSEKLAPNYEHYPYSDARAYDRNAQTALIGNGFVHFNNIEIRRPLHAAYLTVLHLIAGQRYEDVILLQIMVLALLPVGLYLVANSLHNRASGLMAALLVIFRESNSIAAAAKITSSHAKLLMVDLLTAMIVVFFSYWAVMWLKQTPKRSLFFALMSGASLGLAMLVRSETIVLSIAPLVLAAIHFHHEKNYKSWFFQVFIFFLGLILIITPWMFRNHQRTGRFTLDSAAFRQLLIIQRFKPLENLEKSQVVSEDPTSVEPTSSENGITPVAPLGPAESGAAPEPAETSETIFASKATSLLREAFKHPDELIKVFTAHYLNNQLQLLLIHPATYRPIDSGINLIGHKNIDKYLDECCSLVGYTRRLPFWKKWDGQLPRQSIVPLLLTAIFLAAGITGSKGRHSGAGLMPGIAVLVYVLFNSALRNSGGRYLLPVDWASIVYYSIGAMQLSQAACRMVSRKLDSNRIENDRALPKDQRTVRNLFSPGIIAALAGILVVGCSVPLIERIAPLRYTEEEHNRMLDAVLSQSSDLPDELRQQLQSFLDMGGSAISGRGLYPQVFPANFGTQESDNGPRSPQPYPRLVFDLINTLTIHITLPINDSAISFPNASDTLVFLCQNEVRPQEEPLAVAVFDPEGHLRNIYLRYPFPEVLACPLSAKIQ